MIGWPTSRSRFHTVKSKFQKIEHIDKRIDYTNRIICLDPVIHAGWR